MDKNLLLNGYVEEVYLRLPFGTLLVGNDGSIFKATCAHLLAPVINWYDDMTLAERSEEIKNTKMILFPKECVAKSLSIGNERVCPLMDLAFKLHKKTHGIQPEVSKLFFDDDLTIVTKDSKGGKGIVKQSELLSFRYGMEGLMTLLKFHIDINDRILHGLAVNAITNVNPY